jgi:hypothetical protein
VLKNAEQVDRVNPITYASPDDPPFLIVHGDKDGTVPINQSGRLFQALKANASRVHFHTIHNAGHGGPGFSTPEVEEMVRRFFEQHLRARADASTSAVAQATTSESTAPEGSDLRRPGNRPRPRILFSQVLERRDADQDGRLSRQEFPAGQPLFDRLDADDDGFITRQEHLRLFPE